MNTGLLLLIGVISLAACRSDAGRPPNAVSASSESLLEGIQRVRVEGHPEVPEFAVVAREQALETLPCTRCHNAPLARMRRGAKAAHWEVALRHAKAETMTCQTCHADPAGGELRLLEGAPVGLNHAYQLCGQCHAAQERDWAGGAHGKRAAGWAPPRVSLSCTGCHNPHAPAFPSRWPDYAGRPEEME